ncbi:MAG: electron transport complex subunit RsxC [Bacteroidota bacterium]|nr:electron transport complex subunit RsxC [Bacteroidota bacterium]
MLKTFPKGGVHPAENKLSAGKGIKEMPLPKQITVPVSQHIGAPAQPVVKRGDKVKTGTLIAKAGGFVSSNLHSPVSGKVKKIDNMMDAAGFKKQCIIIDTDGDEWEEGIDTSNDLIKDISATPDEIRNKISEAGIVGMGGATFPTHVKLSIPDGKSIDHIIINGAECEPYLTSDHRVMLEKGHHILIGTQLLMKATGVSKAIIGIENNKHNAIEFLTNIAKEYDGIQIQPLKIQYPQGGEKQLIKTLLNREVPSGGLPLDIGCVVQNVGTAVAVYEAVQKNKPLIERVVCVTGKSVKEPCNLIARIGTPLSELIEEAGGLPNDTGKVISGGPMMGKAVPTTHVPVTKGTSGITIFNKKESKRYVESNCIRCARCVSACPAGLEPYNLKNISENEDWEMLEQEHVMDCIECGSCSYTCPANIPLLDYIRLGKANVSQIIRSRKK